MKKILVIVIIIIALLMGSVFIFNKTYENTSENDKRYIDNILGENIKPGMSPSQINEFLETFNTQLGLWECPEENQRGEDCVGERLLVAVIDLPGNHWILGKGTAQVYFSIGKDNF